VLHCTKSPQHHRRREKLDGAVSAEG